MRCNGDFRFAALVAFARARRRRRPLDRALRAARRARRPATRRARRPIRPRTSRTCSRRFARSCSSGSASRSGTRRRTSRPRRGGRRRSRGRASPREPGGVLPRRRRLPRVPRAPGRRRADRVAIVDEDGVGLGRHDGIWRFTPGQRRGLGVASAEPLFALRSDACDRTRSSSVRARSLAIRTIAARGTLYVAVDRAEAKLRYRSPVVGAPWPDGRRVRARARRAGGRGRARAGRRPLRRRRRRRSRSDHGDDWVGSRAMTLALSRR